MPNHERLSATVVSHIEDAIDAMRDAHADGQITPAEVLAVMDRLWTAYETSMHADQGVRLAVTAARSGPDSPSLHRQLAEIRQERARIEAQRPRLVVLKGGREPDTAA